MDLINLNKDQVDIVLGVHSISQALLNPARQDSSLYCTDESLENLLSQNSQLRSKYKERQFKTHQFSGHQVQEEAKKIFKIFEWEYSRVPSNLFLITSKKQLMSTDKLFKEIEIQKEKERVVRIIILDQITDIHNAGAIFRTASFYGIKYIIVNERHSFTMSPGFYRIASGGIEDIEVVSASNLSRLVGQLKERGVHTVALSEHETSQVESKNWQNEERSMALILGNEEKGISHAILRLVDERLSLTSQGQIQSLNVSVAAAIAMEKCFAFKKNLA